MTSVSIQDLAVWRFSRLSLDHAPDLFPPAIDDENTFLLRLIGNTEVIAAVQTIDEAISKSVLTSLASKLRTVRRFADLSTRDRRLAGYFYDLAVSAVLRHDTGSKGSLALVGLGSQKVQYFDGSTEVILPGDTDASSDFDLFEAYNTQADLQARLGLASHLKAALKGKPYAFRVDCSNRFQPSASVTRSVQAITQTIGEIISNYLRSQNSAPFFVPYSADFLFEDQDVYLLEIHVPPRGIELQFYGFRPFQPQLTFPADGVLRGLFARLQGSVPLARAKVEFFNPFSTIGFFVAESKLLVKHEAMIRHEFAPHDTIDDVHSVRWNLELLEPPPSASVDLEIPARFAQQYVDNRRLVTEDLEKANVRTPPKILVPPATKLDIDDVEAQLGQILACKQLIHKSWWNAEKQRVRLLNMNFSWHRATLKKAIANGCIIEKVLLGSRDSHQNHGELKVIALVTNI